jgi:hypothetical protein
LFSGVFGGAYEPTLKNNPNAVIVQYIYSSLFPSNGNVSLGSLLNTMEPILDDSLS